MPNSHNGTGREAGRGQRQSRKSCAKRRTKNDVFGDRFAARNGWLVGVRPHGGSQWEPWPCKTAEPLVAALGRGGIENYDAQNRSAARVLHSIHFCALRVAQSSMVRDADVRPAAQLRPSQSSATHRSAQNCQTVGLGTKPAILPADEVLRRPYGSVAPLGSAPVRVNTARCSAAVYARKPGLSWAEL